MINTVRPLGIVYAAATFCLLSCGCETGSAERKNWPTDSPAATSADGIYVSHVRVRVMPSDVDRFETLLRRCAAIARAARLPEAYEWLCYRASPCRYDIIRFSDTIDGFATPHEFDAFVNSTARAGGGEAFKEIHRLLESIEFEIEWQFLAQQYSAWSTVESMTTTTHPKARVTEYVVKNESSKEFDRALSARTDFLRKHKYPLPVEGFVILGGPSVRAWQVVFPVSWERYHASDSIDAFFDHLPPADRTLLRRLDERLADTVSIINRYDVDYAPELRYDTAR